MMQCRPSIAVHVVNIGFRFNNRPKCILFLVSRCKYSLVNGSLSKDTLLAVYFVSTVNQMLDVLNISLSSSIIKVLENTPSEFVLTNLQRSLCKSW